MAHILMYDSGGVATSGSLEYEMSVLPADACRGYGAILASDSHPGLVNVWIREGAWMFIVHTGAWHA